MAKTYIDKKGYKRFSDSNLKVSRWVAQKKVGGKLLKGAVVHHINRSKLDDRSSNLWVFKSAKNHNKIHRMDKKKTGFW